MPPPQTHATLLQAERSQHAVFHAARLVGAERREDGIHIHVRPRGKSETASLHVDKVVLANGPAHGQIIASNLALASLADQGLVQSDPLKLGLATAPDGRAIGLQGPVTGLYVAGPLARGTVGELMGVPEVTAWAEHVARQILATLPAPSTQK